MYKHAKLIKTCIWLLLFVLLGFGIRFGASKVIADKEINLIKSSYLNYHKKSLHKHLPIKKLNNIPASYKWLTKKDKQRLEKQYVRIYPLYTKQYLLQNEVKALYDGKNNYSNQASNVKCRKLVKEIPDIQNLSLQSHLLVKTNQIQVWIKQTNKAIKLINTIASQSSQQGNISFSDYIQAKANYALIKNVDLKNSAKKQLTEIDNLYQKTNLQDKKQQQDAISSAAQAAKNAANQKYSHSPAQVTIDLVTKAEQTLTHKLKDLDINSDKAIIADGTSLELAQKKSGWYRIVNKIDYDGTIAGDQYKAKESINSGDNNIQNYSLNKDGALILDDTDPDYDQYSVLAKVEDFDTDAEYLNVEQDQKLLLMVADEDYLIITPNSDLSADSSKMITLSSSDYDSLVQWIDQNTQLIADQN